MEARAYHKKFSSIKEVPKFLNDGLLWTGWIVVVAGPAIGYYDVNYDRPMHMVVVGVFVVGEIV